MKKQTAVDWLETKLETSIKLTPPEWEMFYDLISQAKQMEKEQIIDAVIFGRDQRANPDYNIVMFGKNLDEYVESLKQPKQ